MKNIKDSIKLFRFNMTYTIIFEIILKLVFLVMLIPLYYAYINLAVKLSGISYLTKETVGKFMKAPSTYAFLFIMFVFMAMCIIMDVSGISYAYHRANYLKKTTPMRMLFVGVRSAIRVLRPRNLPMFLFVLCYLPVITTVIFDFQLLNIRVPYMIDIVSINKYVTIVAVAIYVLLVISTCKYTFLVHVYNVEKLSYRKSIDRTKELLKGRRVKTIGGLISWLIVVVGVPVLVFFLYTGPILNRVLESEGLVKAATIVYEALKVVFSVLYVILGLPIVYSYICNQYYDLVPEDEDRKTIDDYEEYDAKKSSKKERKILAVIIALAIIFDAAFYGLKRADIISLNVEYMDKVTITAHRGDCSNAPENTLAAFQSAIDNGADIIELDVRETADGEIVIMHDESLRRTCGVDKKVGKLTYEELLQYKPTAAYKGKDKEQFADEKIPTLSEAIELIGDSAKINIELKPASTDKGFAKKVAAIIEEYDYYDQCVVASLNYGSIKKIKTIDPKIETVYVMAVAMGDFYGLECADAFSIKSRYINNDVVKNAHKLGKQVYAWTVDDRAILENMMLMNVDSIITNKPKEMRKAMYENYYGDTLIQRINLYLGNQI